jgi:hypothetical protein
MGEAPGNNTGGASRADEVSGEVLLIRAAPALIRLGWAAGWRATQWGFTASIRVSSRFVRAAVAGDSPAEVFQAAGAELREYVRRVLEIVEPPDEPGPAEAPGRRSGDGDGAARDTSIPTLRRRGAELLRRSAEIDATDDTHPAYARILENLAPDEGRVLRLFALEGPQPAVDIRTAPPLGIGSELVEGGLTMIGEEAGCRRPDSIKAYLNNLYRLGLIWFSREALPDLAHYHVLEAQPDVQTKMAEASRARTVRRSIQLTEFGQDFCATVLPLHTDELEALPRQPESGKETPTGTTGGAPGAGSTSG